MGNVKTAIFVGLTTVDFVYSISDDIRENTKYAASEFDVFAGGPAANAAITYSLLGGAAFLYTCVGTNAISQIARLELDKYGVAITDLSPTSTTHLPLSSIVTSPASHNRIVFSAHEIVQMPIDLCQLDLMNHRYETILIDGHLLEISSMMANRGILTGTCVVLDGGSWKSGLDQILPYVDYAICSASFRPPNCKELHDAVAYLFEAGIAYMAFTHDDKPIKWWTSDASGEIPTEPINAIDTLAAGDVFHGAFIAALGREHLGFEGALRYAAHIASQSCRYFGPREWHSHINSGDF